MATTRFTELVGCPIPIQQAGMGAVSPPELAAAVSEAGALGMVGTARRGITVSTLGRMLDWMQEQTRRPFGVNFVIPEQWGPPDRACIELAARRARVVEFFYGEPNRDLVKIVHDGGALADWQIGSRDEALRANDAGCDFIVAQGIEAGGHVRGTLGTFALLDECRRAVDVPVLAAGGIGTGKVVAAALMAGADGVRVGTRFVAATEAGAHPTYVAALIAARAEDTEYTTAFSIGWYDAPHRVLRSCVAAAETFEGDTVGEETCIDGTRVPVPRFGVLAVDRDVAGAVYAMPLWAGTSIDAVRRLQPAAEIVRELADEAGWSEQ